MVLLEEQTTYIFTKALDESTFTRLVGKLGMLNSFSNLPCLYLMLVLKYFLQLYCLLVYF